LRAVADLVVSQITEVIFSRSLTVAGKHALSRQKPNVQAKNDAEATHVGLKSIDIQVLLFLYHFTKGGDYFG
jgi:hypothetical protein